MSTLHAALHAALRRLPAFRDLPATDLLPMPLKGVAHDHVRLRGRGLVARIPRWSQVGLDAEANLRHQAAAFRRAAPSGHTPELVACLPPEAALPMGVLLVTEIAGRPPHLPGDMPAIARALAALHRMPLPAAEERQPLASSADPAEAALALVERQAVWFDRAELVPEARARLREEMEAARALRLALHLDGAPPVTLVGSDVHPGNFLIDGSGKAWFTDLERAQYGHPAMDLAHASLLTSTMWDPEVAAELSAEETAAFIADWEAEAGAELARTTRPWLKPMRRLTWLRTLSWMARWRVEGAALSPGMPETLRSHLDRRAAVVFEPRVIERVSNEWR